MQLVIVFVSITVGDINVVFLT